LGLGWAIDRILRVMLCGEKEKSSNSREHCTHRGMSKSGSFGLPNLTRRTPMKTSRWTKCMLVVAFFMLSIVSKVVAAEKAFYEGKTLTVLINYAAGGPTDVEGRIFAKHLAKHISGRPTLIVQYGRWRSRERIISARFRTRWPDSCASQVLSFASN
jgi:hypothetical protein